jgi:hypothetical protein
MSTLDYCDARTQTGKLCSRKAVCDSSKHGSKGAAYCKQHFDSKGLNYYDPSKGKFVVNKISRVAHDKTTGLPMRYVQDLTTKEKKLYKKEIEETNKYYKRTGLVKGRKDVRFISGTKEGRGLVKRKPTPYKPKTSSVKRFKRESKSQNAKNLPKQRSSYSIEFEKRYGFKVSDLSKVKKLLPDTDVDMIVKKGEAAYASGSRPSVTGSGGAKQWGLARLASVAVGGKALQVDGPSLVGPKSLKVIFRK